MADLNGLDEDEKGTHSVSTPGGRQNFLVINEPGLYTLILKSRKSEAKAFKRWVTHEVLPQIRKTGSYSAQPKSVKSTPFIHRPLSYLGVTCVPSHHHHEIKAIHCIL